MIFLQMTMFDYWNLFPQAFSIYFAQIESKNKYFTSDGGILALASDQQNKVSLSVCLHTDDLNSVFMTYHPLNADLLHDKAQTDWISCTWE